MCDKYSQTSDRYRILVDLTNNMKLGLETKEIYLLMHVFNRFQKLVQSSTSLKLRHGKREECRLSIDNIQQNADAVQKGL